LWPFPHPCGLHTPAIPDDTTRPTSGVYLERKREDMSEIAHDDIAWFVGNRINLPKDKADEYRAQVNRLRDRLENKINDDPSFNLVKMLHAGSVAKGTALRTVNDLDVAVYVKAGNAPKSDPELLPWLAARLAEANPNMNPDQFSPQTHCVTISFRGSGLDVDAVPVLYESDADDCGWLVHRGGISSTVKSALCMST
jgi:tRNA nucleotidyltransferase (CCA-adding enzyme)